MPAAKAGTMLQLCKGVENIVSIHREETLKRLENLRPIDDIFMRQMFKNDIPFVESILQILLGIDLKITSVNTQYKIDMQSIDSHSLCLDVYAEDSNGKKYNIEIQRGDSGASPRRARYHASAMDIAHLKQGQDFIELPEVYVVFITEHDILGEGNAIYSFERRNVKTGMPLNDGSYIVYVNGEYRGKDLIGDLMHDFMCADPDEMKLKFIAGRTRYLKKTEEGVSQMCPIIEEYAKEYAEEYAKEYAEKYAKERINEYNLQMAVKLLELGELTCTKISKCTKLSMEEIINLAKTNGLAYNI